jgi:6,7-dimethyl-8-ribityllumazine synthase
MAQRLKIAFIKGHWYANIVEKALDGFVAEMKQSGQQAHLVTYDVPGAYEIPLLAQRLAQSGAFDAIVGAAFVVDGGVYRADFVSHAAVTGLMEAQLKTGVPMFSVILTPHSFDGSEKQTGVFSNSFLRKGAEAALAVRAIAAINLDDGLASMKKADAAAAAQMALNAPAAKVAAPAKPEAAKPSAKPSAKALAPAKKPAK